MPTSKVSKLVNEGISPSAVSFVHHSWNLDDLVDKAYTGKTATELAAAPLEALYEEWQKGRVYPDAPPASAG